MAHPGVRIEWSVALRPTIRNDNHHFKWWFHVGPIRATITGTPKRRTLQALVTDLTILWDGSPKPAEIPFSKAE